MIKKARKPPPEALGKSHIPNKDGAGRTYSERLRGLLCQGRTITGETHEDGTRPTKENTCPRCWGIWVAGERERRGGVV